MSKILTPGTSRAESEQESDLQNVLGLKSMFQRSDNLNDGESEGVGLRHAAEGFELGEQQNSRIDVSMNILSVESTVDIV